MTKERRLAIEMWINIRNMLLASDGESPMSIPCYKDMFCSEHGLHWAYDCWFCQYMPGCDKCPLDNCRPDGYYGSVKANWRSTDVRVEACNNIIKALGGKV